MQPKWQHGGNIGRTGHIDNNSKKSAGHHPNWGAKGDFVDNSVAIIWRKSSCCWGSRLVIRPKDFTIGGALCGHFTPDWKIRCGYLGFRILSRFEVWGWLGSNICSETAFLIVERRCFCKMCKITSDLPVVPWEKGSTLPIGWLAHFPHQKMYHRATRFLLHACTNVMMYTCCTHIKCMHYTLHAHTH